MLSSTGAKLYSDDQKSPKRMQPPSSFKAKLDEIEDEILQLAQELSFCKKEVKNLQSEQATVAEVAQTQSDDIERYLNKETKILEDIINKSHQRQLAENSRFMQQCNQTKRMDDDLNAERIGCVERVQQVQCTVGVETDKMDVYTQPLSARGPGGKADEAK